MEADELRRRVTDLFERYRQGIESHGLRVRLLSFEQGVAEVRVERLDREHSCGECDVLVPIALNLLSQDLRTLEGMRDVKVHGTLSTG